MGHSGLDLLTLSSSQRSKAASVGGLFYVSLDAIRRPRSTPIWKLEAALECRSCKKGRYAPTVHKIKLTQELEITA